MSIISGTDWGRLAVWIWIVLITMVAVFATIPVPPRNVVWIYQA